MLALGFKQNNGHMPVLHSLLIIANYTHGSQHVPEGPAARLYLMLRRLLAFLTVLPLKFLWENPYRCCSR